MSDVLGNTRNAGIYVLATGEDRERIKIKARELGMTMSAFMVYTSLHWVPGPTTPPNTLYVGDYYKLRRQDTGEWKLQCGKDRKRFGALDKVPDVMKGGMIHAGVLVANYAKTRPLLAMVLERFPFEEKTA